MQIQPDTIHLIGVFIGGILTYALKDLIVWLSPKAPKDEHDPAARFRKDAQVHELLTEIRLRMAAARASVFQFHNGEHFFTGEPIQKVSATHESVEMGRLPCLGDNQSQPLSLMTSIVDRVVSGDTSVRVVESMPECYARFNMVNLGIRSWCVIPMHHHHKLVGYVILHWTEAHTMLDEERTWLVSKVNQIETLLIG